MTDLSKPDYFAFMTFESRLQCALKLIFETNYPIAEIAAMVLPERYVSEFTAIFILKYDITPELLRGYIWTERYNGCPDLSKSKNKKLAKLYLLQADVDLSWLNEL